MTQSNIKSATMASGMMTGKWASEKLNETLNMKSQKYIVHQVSTRNRSD